VHAYSDWYYYMVMNPADRIQTFGSCRIWILPDHEKKHQISGRIRIQIWCTSTANILADKLTTNCGKKERKMNLQFCVTYCADKLQRVVLQ